MKNILFTILKSRKNLVILYIAVSLCLTFFVCIKENVLFELTANTNLRIISQIHSAQTSTRKALFLMLSKKPQVEAFLDMISWAEGTAIQYGNNSYKMQYANGSFTELTNHPQRVISAPFAHRHLSSSASGRYQFLAATWNEVAAALDLADFSPQNQDLAALFLIYRANALLDVIELRIKSAIAKTSRIWASFPGAPYGQPTHPSEELITYFYWRYIHHCAIH
ncbi:MAG: glycoside hydrolase family 104 protein [Candidatus Babeliaceae bacterium]|nr:glycoside hydrolase family 104 protein [Candidatus Babeliaceae bacterium]